MIFHETKLADAFLIDLELRGDERGFFARSFCEDEFAAKGLVSHFVQTNTSRTSERGTLRGLHYQRAPYAEAKLMRCIKGAILDVIVDLRSQSATYLQHGMFELSAENRRQLYVPPGFAHGFLTLSDDVEVVYPVSARYEPSAEGGLRFDDPSLGLELPIAVTTVSEKDRSWPAFNKQTAPVF
jgi:dTDP-4-dehydrorhamnose 3,5-epimerase